MWKNKNEFLVYIIHYLCKEKSHTKLSLKAYIKDWNIKANVSIAMQQIYTVLVA